MGPDLDRMLLCKAHCRAHRRRVGGVKPASNVGQIDVRHHRRIVTDAIQAKAFAHVAIDGQTHARSLKRQSWWPSPNSPVGCLNSLSEFPCTALIPCRLVRTEGLEPSRETSQGILSPLRLPFRHVRVANLNSPAGARRLSPRGGVSR